jgi:sugar/nucleoside kinase (ribokinase family)
MSLLVVGSVAFDALETPFGRADRELGGAATYFSVAASYFTPVNLVGVVGEDFTRRDEGAFRGRRIDTAGLERKPGKTFFWAARYSHDFRERTTLATELNVFADFNPRLPQKFRNSTHIFLANIHPDLQRGVMKQVAGRPKIIALDTMNYWIERTPVELKETLKHAQVLMINDEETRQLAGEHNLLRAARHVFTLGPQTLVIKRGEFGAMMVTRHSIFSVPGFPLAEVRDPTGAGDSFAGGFMGYLAHAGRISEKTLRQAMVYGSVMGSFTVERIGLGRLRALKRKQIRQRARQFHKLTQFHMG